ITGDLTNRGGKEQAKKITDYARQYNPNIYAQAGNFDCKEVEDYLIEQKISLHGNAFIREDIGIFGVGGSNITPLNTPNEYEENKIESFILQGYQQIKDLPLKLFVSHAPPFNTKVDMLTSGLHVGSTAVREFIEKYQPEVCLTGHIHEAKGEDYIGRTVIINPGMLKDRGYGEIVKEKGALKVVLKQIAWF
ncbi:MAG: metallophosphoesterase, partial [Candidatus Omnitrophica bacterium]|nr:metallophosphoesterase [Candidatus Omnitrophota bacterium]